MYLLFDFAGWVICVRDVTFECRAHELSAFANRRHR